MATSLDRMLSILQCPRTGTAMSYQNGRLFSAAGEEYPVVHGIPILVRQVQDFHVTPPPSAFVSKNIASYSPPPYIADPTAWCLHLGSGNVPASDSRVISMDILPTESVDLVAEAETLPFKTQSLDYVASGAVFEHVFNPVQSAKEVRRVLKDGGEFFIDTAFLQGYHGFPSHYFNMTPQAVEAFICDDFILEESYVPHAAMMTHAIATQFDRFLELISESERIELLNMPLKDALDRIRTSRRRDEGLTAQISEYGHRSLAASFAVRARKPANYDVETNGRGSTPHDRAAYYAARMGVIQRHHEIEIYRRYTAEKNKPGPRTPIPSLLEILTRCKVTRPLADGAFHNATENLRQADSALTAIRDDAIRAYLS